MIIGIGIDLADVARMEREIARSGDGFLATFLSDAELAECRAERHPARACATRFAVKEAFAKALGTGVYPQLSWHEIAVQQVTPGRFVVTALGRAAGVLAALGAIRVLASVSHDPGLAAAVVALEQ